MEPTQTTRPPTDPRRLWHKLPVRLGVCAASAAAVLLVGLLMSVPEGWPDGVGNYVPEVSTRTPSREVPSSTTVPDAELDAEGGHFFDDFIDQGLPWQSGAALPWETDAPASAEDGSDASAAPAPATESSDWVRATPIMARVPVALSYPSDWTVAETNDPAPEIQVVSADGGTGVAVYAIPLRDVSLQDYADATRSSIGDRLDGWEQTSFGEAKVYDRDGFLLSGRSNTAAGVLYHSVWFAKVGGDALVVHEQYLTDGDPSAGSLVDEVVSSITITAQA